MHFRGSGHGRPVCFTGEDTAADFAAGDLSLITSGSSVPHIVSIKIEIRRTT